MPRNPLRWVAVACVSIVLLVAFVVFREPVQSTTNYCTSWVEQSSALYQKWEAQNNATRGDPDLFNKIGIVPGAPGDLAIFFEKLEKVAPEDVRPDVVVLHDAYNKLSLTIGQTTSPVTLLNTSLVLGRSTFERELFVKEWTRNNCPSVWTTQSVGD